MQFFFVQQDRKGGMTQVDVRIVPVPLRGKISVPASKSELHRMLICAAFSDRPVRIGAAAGYLSGDIEATVRCLGSLGASVAAEDDAVTVTPVKEHKNSAVLYCGESGSTLRMLLPAAAAVCGALDVTGRGSLLGRPVGELTDEMQRHGVKFSSRTLPFSTEGLLSGGSFSVPGDITSQYLSGLLLASPLLEGGTSIELTSELASAGYAVMTLDIMERFGVHAIKDGTRYVCTGKGYVSPEKLDTGGDFSAAAAFITMAAAGKDCDIVLTGLNAASCQPDRKVLDIVERSGADIEVSDTGIRVRSSSLGALSADAGEVPDLIPVLSAASCASTGTSVFRGCARLRYKESDRMSGMTAMLSSMGARVTSDGDTFTVGRPEKGISCIIDPSGDHRTVMAAAVAAYALSVPVTVRNAEAVEKSYPRFFDDLRSLGGKADVI